MGTADMSKKNIEDKYIDPFAEYLISGEPDRAQKAYAWQTAIGLQDVDKIQPSQYLGFHATNDVFANNSWYFRNALVRANYTNLSLGVREDLSFLELFLRNLLMGEKNELKNRYMHIAWKETTHSNNKRHIERHIEQHIDPKGAIKQLEIILDTNVVSERTKSNILNLFNEFGYEKIFSRGDD